MLDGWVVYGTMNACHDDDGIWGVPTNLLEVSSKRKVFGKLDCSGFFRETIIAICEFYVLDVNMGDWVERWVSIQGMPYTQRISGRSLAKHVHLIS